MVNDFESPKFEANSDEILPKAKKNYLENHLEPPLSDEEKVQSAEEAFLQLPESVRQPLNPEVKYGKKGVEKVELKEGWVLEYEYEALGEKDIRHVPYEGTGHAKKLVQLLHSADYRKLTQFTIKNEKNETIDLKDLPVKEIFFSTKAFSDRPSFFNDGRIVSEFSPNSVFGILSILHEGGHAILQESQFEKQGNFKQIARSVAHNAVYRMPTIFHFLLPEKVIRAASEEVLSTERNAWAIALSKLRPSLKGFEVSNEDIENTIHRSRLSLASHSQRIREINRINSSEPTTPNK